MYQPEKYKNDEPQFIFDFVEKHPFATVVIQGEHLLATHIPVLLEGNPKKFKAFAHIANHNPMYGSLKNGVEILLIFKSSDAYISSSWYSKIDIPTWDYSAVHINAKVQLQNPSELQLSLEKLITHFEKDKENPIIPSDIPHAMWEENFKNITGFWLHPVKCTGIAKLHQGFSEQDIENITTQLVKQNTCPHWEVNKLIKKQHGI